MQLDASDQYRTDKYDERGTFSSSSVFSLLVKIACSLAVIALSFWLTLWGLDRWDDRAPIQQSIRLQTNAAGPITEQIPPDPAKARVSDGRLFLSAPFIPKDAKSTLRIHVVAYASAQQPNVAVVTVFRGGQEAPLRLISKPVSGNKLEEIQFTIDVPADGTTPTDFAFRIGPGRPGSIFFNGSEGVEMATPLQTSATITERN